MKTKTKNRELLNSIITETLPFLKLKTITKLFREVRELSIAEGKSKEQMYEIITKRIEKEFEQIKEVKDKGEKYFSERAILSMYNSYKNVKHFSKRIDKEIKILSHKKEHSIGLEEANIIIEWKKSKTWGNNPHLTATVTFSDNPLYYKFCRVSGMSVSGCGYDKESQVMSNFLTKFLYKDLCDNFDRATKLSQALPYGLSINGWENRLNFGGCVGISSLQYALIWLGYELTLVTNNENINVYRLIKKS